MSSLTWQPFYGRARAPPVMKETVNISAKPILRTCAEKGKFHKAPCQTIALEADRLLGLPRPGGAGVRSTDFLLTSRL